MQAYTQSHKLYEITLRMSKDYTSFLYFILESNENIAFYSTLPFEKGQSYRDVVIRSTPELQKDLQSILEHLKNKITYDVLGEKYLEGC